MERILIADDEALMRQLVADFLRPEGYEVLEAVDGKQALDIFNEQKPDLVLLDVMMPGYDGWTVCREIRRTSTVPIIMITAKDEEIDQLFAYDLGVDDYITKPFSPKLLVAKMKKTAPMPYRRKVWPLTVKRIRFLLTVRVRISVRRNINYSII